MKNNYRKLILVLGISFLTTFLSILLIIHSLYSDFKIIITTHTQNIYTNDFRKTYSKVDLLINNSKFTTYIADTPDKQTLGLSNSSPLNDNEAMLFVFDTEGVQNFWMKDMNYDLDIIWLDKDLKVVGFNEFAKAQSYNKQDPHLSETFFSPTNTLYVLEVKSGTVKKINLLIGDKILKSN